MSLRNLLFAALLVSLAGCSTPGPMVKLRIAGGEKVTFDLSRATENEVFRVVTAGLLPKPETKQGVYVFNLLIKDKAKPVQVKVEDVTEDKASILCDVANPELTKETWSWTGEPLDKDSKLLAWVHHLDDGFCVYRFTITLSDGRTSVLTHAAMYPALVKSRMRAQMGIE